MAVKPDTKPHVFVWTPINNQQKQTLRSRCDECGSRAGHKIHVSVLGDPLCKACRGTGKDLGSDNPIRDANPVVKCLVCDGSGESSRV